MNLGVVMWKQPWRDRRWDKGIHNGTYTWSHWLGKFYTACVDYVRQQKTCHVSWRRGTVWGRNELIKLEHRWGRFFTTFPRKYPMNPGRGLHSLSPSLSSSRVEEGLFTAQSGTCGHLHSVVHGRDSVNTAFTNGVGAHSDVLLQLVQVGELGRPSVQLKYRRRHVTDHTMWCVPV